LFLSESAGPLTGHFFAMTQDSTEVDRLKAELAETKEELRKVRFMLDLVPFYVAYVDGDWTYRLQNTRAHDWFDSPELLAGNPLVEVIGEEVFDELYDGIEHALQGIEVGYDRRIRFGNQKSHVKANYVPDIVDGVVVGMGAVIENMTARRRNEERVRQAAVVFDAARDAIIIFDSKHRIIRVNAAFTELTGYDSSEASGERASDFAVPLRGHSLERVWTSMVRDGYWAGELYFRHKDGSVRHVWVTINCVADDDAFIHNYVAVLTSMDTDTTLSFQAHHDGLTGLPNRLLLQARLEHTLERAQRHKQPAALLYLDLDVFKPINDTCGHAEGDAVLIEVGRRLSKAVRAQDTAARLGGDEFVILLDDYAKEQDVDAVAWRIQDALNAPIEIEGRRHQVGVSIGIALFPEHSQEAVGLMANADAALYAAKAAGKGCSVRFGAPRPLVRTEPA